MKKLFTLIVLMALLQGAGAQIKSWNFSGTQGIHYDKYNKQQKFAITSNGTSFVDDTFSNLVYVKNSITITQTINEFKIELEFFYQDLNPDSDNDKIIFKITDCVLEIELTTASALKGIDLIKGKNATESISFFGYKGNTQILQNTNGNEPIDKIKITINDISYDQKKTERRSFTINIMI
jgi:hypothetical protein